MKLEKALKLIQADIDDKDVEWDSQLGEAYKLSFEALKCRKYQSEQTSKWADILLLGETP